MLKKLEQENVVTDKLIFGVLAKEIVVLYTSPPKVCVKSGWRMAASTERLLNAKESLLGPRFAVLKAIILSVGPGTSWFEPSRRRCMTTSNSLESDVMTKPFVIKRSPTSITQSELQRRLFLVRSRCLFSLLVCRRLQVGQILVFVLDLFYMLAPEGCGLGKFVA